VKKTLDNNQKTNTSVNRSPCDAALSDDSGPMMATTVIEQVIDVQQRSEERTKISYNPGKRKVRQKVILREMRTTLCIRFR
jgi:hypothetical protein